MQFILQFSLQNFSPAKIRLRLQNIQWPMGNIGFMKINKPKNANLFFLASRQSPTRIFFTSALILLKVKKIFISFYRSTVSRMVVYAGEVARYEMISQISSHPNLEEVYSPPNPTNAKIFSQPFRRFVTSFVLRPS